MDRTKLDKLRNKVTKEFNMKFFNNKMNILDMGYYKYAVDAVNSESFKTVDESVIDILLNKDNSLDSLYEMVIEFKN